MKSIFNNIHLTYLKIITKNKLIKQRDKTDCGAACLATIANLNGINYPTSKIREAAGTDQKGTSAYGLIKTAEDIGFESQGVKAQNNDLTKDLKLPVIAHLINDNYAHYVVILKIKKYNLIIFDPAFGLKVISRSDFLAKWTNILILFSCGKGEMVKTNTDIEKGSFIKKHLRNHKKLLGYIFVASLLYTVLGIAGSFYFKYMIDSILVNGLTKTLHIISSGILIISVFKVMMDAFRNHLTLFLSQQIDISLIMDYIEHILELPISFYEKREIGEIISRVHDSGKIRDALSSAAISIMIDSFLIIGGGTILYLQSKYLFKIAVILIPIYIILVLSFAKKHNKVRKKEMEKGAELQSTLVETIEGIKTIKTHNNERQSYINNEEKFLSFIEEIFAAGKLQNIQNSIDNLLAAIGEIILLWAGGYQVIEGNLTIGQLITFNALLVYFYDPLQNLIKLQPKIQEALVALDRLKEIMVLDKTKTNNETISLNQIKGNIIYENVDFIYNMKNKVLKNVSFNIEAGETVAFVGESGSGKTTIIKLLMKFYSVSKGNIYLDGKNIEDINTKNYREKVGYVPQNIFLFNKTIKENIDLNGREDKLNKVVKAAQKAKIHSHINQLPQRYQTEITEKGKNLSGGEKQRIAIARTFFKNPDLMIFDEATNNLDYSTENNILNIINKFSSNKTVIIIAHRLKTIKNVDKIFYMKKGKITEKGTHKKLLAQKGDYYNLWTDQKYYN
ncbi:MAG: peptidase domain-containing ABC transporter [Halanaerobiales bacterium]|nr:peptidase domain-containing ABC transporter [Halanaerobiales bacterium]